MKILFLGGDRRHVTVMEDLARLGNKVDVIGYSSIQIDNMVNKEIVENIWIGDYDMIILPMGGIGKENWIESLDGKICLSDNWFNGLSQKTTVFTGLVTERVKCFGKDNKIISFFDDEEVKRINNKITVNVILNKIGSYMGGKICILGFGNIGQGLYNGLENDDNVMVGIINQSDKDILGAKAFYTSDLDKFKEVLKKSDLIINTVPKNILSEELLEDVHGYILDIASYPHGISRDLYCKQKLNYELYLGIPSEYDPILAGQILLKVIKNNWGAKRVGLAITSSFCTLKKVLDSLKEMRLMGYDIYPIVSTNILKYDTRFGISQEFINEVERITGKRFIDNIISAEAFGPSNKMDVMVVFPATGNTLAKMANGITDNVVNLAIKATMRNQSPIVLAISTNDGLGLNAENIMHLYNTKNVYFVPFGQDDYENKPNSLVAHYDLLIETIEMALNHKQIQPLLQDYSKAKVKIKKK